MTEAVESEAIVFVVDDEARGQLVQGFLGPWTRGRRGHERARQPLVFGLHPEPSSGDDEVIGGFLAERAFQVRALGKLV